MRCPTCGADGADGARFCSSCGQALTARTDERRVVTVLFADLVGFTSMSESLDPEQVKRFVDGAFERLVADVTAFGGRVDKIVGDAIVALFGAPTAHEDDAERAVRAALRMQQTLGEYATETGVDIRMRVGVNTGEVLVGALRAGGDYTAMGDVVNIAARLQTSADPGTVLVGEATYQSTSDVIVFEDRGALVPRGRESPLSVWVAKGALLPPGYRPRRARSPLVGRDAELTMIETAVSLSIRHERSQLVLLLGEAGMGKTRLGNEVAAIVADQWPDALVLNGRCVPYGEANPWWPIADGLRDVLDLALDEPLDRALEACRTSVERVVPSRDAARVDAITNGLLHVLGYDGPLRGLDPARARTEATQALLAYVESSLRARPIVVRLADLHWADELVLETIDELSEQLARAPFVLLATARRTLLDRWSPRTAGHNTLVLNLDPLDRTASGAIVDSLADFELAANVRDMLLDRAGGNPLYLEELVTLVGEGDVTTFDVALELPDTLRGLIAARIDALTPDEQHTIEDAAVWGASGPIEALERLAEKKRGRTDIPAVVASLEAKEVLTVDRRTWAFRSDLVREVAYSRLTKLGRFVRHHGIAAYLDAFAAGRFIDDWHVDTVSRHYTEAALLLGEVGPEAVTDDDIRDRALHWIDEAARRADQSAAWVIADRLRTQMLELAAPHGDYGSAELDVLVARARARCELWKYDDARDDALLAVALAEAAGDDKCRAAATAILGSAESRRGNVEEASRLLADAVEIYDRLGDVEGRAEARRLSGMALLYSHDLAGAEEPVSDALADFRSVGDRRGEAWALQNLAWIAFVTGRIERAEGWLEDAASVFDDLGDMGGLAWTHGLMAFVRLLQGRVDESRQLASMILQESERRADQWGQGMMLIVLSSIELWEGRTESAEHMAQRATKLLGSVGDPQGLGQAQAVLARAMVMRGRVAEGLAVVEAASASSDAGVESMARSMHLALGVALGDLTMIERWIDMIDSLPSAVPVGMTNPTEVEATAALALLELGRGDDAARLMGVVLERDPTSAFAQSVGALSAAVTHDRSLIDQLGARVRDNPRATYLDRLYVSLAESLGCDDDGVGFARLAEELTSTGDEVARAVLCLATSVAARAAGWPDADARAHDAEVRWADLGVEPRGWVNLFTAAAARPAAP
ncbi:MAG TPA: adenylate/guanylate cyclase domain-containing protein [Microthrixaceae bacterium]|nr:adenylate/guanylate cyclase domain-containing protein [Microthrixaceae bacterium]